MTCTVVTGAGGGLGSAVVRHLLSLGDVAALDAGSGAARLDAFARELEAQPRASRAGRLLPLAVDVSSTDAWAKALAGVEAELAPPTGAAFLVGGWRGGRSLAEDEEGTLPAMLAANVETTHRSLRAVLPGMIARGRGSVVVVGARAAAQPWTSAGAAAYAASKAAVVTLAQTVATEVLERGVRVNAVLPGTLDTAANRRAMPDADASRWVSIEALARVIAFLLSDDARDVSGAAIPVYGRT